MEIVSLSHMPFMGKQRKPGDKISEKDWMSASQTARESLVSQGYVRVGGGERTAHKAEVMETGEFSSDAIELMQGISAKLDRLLSIVAPGATIPSGPARAISRAAKALTAAPKKTAAKKKAKAAKRKPRPAPAAQPPVGEDD